MALVQRDETDERARTAAAAAAMASLPLLPSCQHESSYVDVDGPIDAEETLIRYDIPFAPKDPRRSLRLRKRLLAAAAAAGTTDSKSGMTGSSAFPASLTSSSSAADGGSAVASLYSPDSVDPNVRVVLDSFILPRRWVDKETGVQWEQHAWPFPSSRTDTAATHRRLHEKLQTLGAKRTGVCPIRTVLVAECYLEVIRQVVVECWERGVLLLQVHAERVAAQAAHRQLFESRVGHAMRLALKGEKDATRAEQTNLTLKNRIAALEQEEQRLRALCADFDAYANEQTLIEERQHTEALGALKKEGLIKRNQLEQMLAVPPPPQS